MKAQRGVGIDVALADLEKAAACGKNGNALLEEGAGQGIEYDIDAAAIGSPSDVIREGERSRVEYMLDPASIEIASLLLAAGGRENVRALRLGDADGRQPDPSRRGMDQHAFAGLEAGKRHERIVRRRKGDRNRGGRGERQPAGDRKDLVDSDSDVGRETSGRHRDHALADPTAVHAFADRRNDAGAFE